MSARGGRGGPQSNRGGNDGGRGRGGPQGSSRGGGPGGAPEQALSVQTVDAASLPNVTVMAQLPHNFGGSRKQALQVGDGTTTDRVALRTALDKAKLQVAQQMQNINRLQPGTEGSQTAVTTNLFPLKSTLATSFTQYDIKVEPEIRNPRVHKEVVRSVLRRHTEALKIPPAILKNKIAYAPRPLQKAGEKSITLVQEGTPNAPGWKSQKYTVTVTPTRDIPATPNGISTEQYVILTSIISEAIEEAGFVKVAGKYLDLENKFGRPIDLNFEGDPFNSLQLVRGMRFVLHPTSRGLLLNADLTFRATRRDSVLDHIKKVAQLFPKAEEMRQAVKEELVGVMCVTTYLHERRKQTFKVSDVLFDKTPLTPIEKRDPTKPSKTYKQYMQEMHGITLTDDKQPLLLVELPKELDKDGKPKKMYFLPELARFVGQSDKARANNALQQCLKQRMLIRPAERFNTIFSIVSSLARDAGVKKYLDDFGLAIDPRCVKAQGRVLPQVGLVAGRGPLAQNRERRSWQVAKGSAITYCPAAPKRWAVLYPNKPRNEGSVKAFVDVILQETINGVATDKSCKWPEPEYYDYRSSRNPRETFDALRRVGESLDEGVQFILVVLADASEDSYAYVKDSAINKWHIPSQCVLERNATSEMKRLSVATRVGAQMLVKLGATLWHAPSAEIPNSLIVGIDFAKSKKEQQYVGFYAARSDDMTFVGAYTSLAGTRQRAAENLGRLLGQAVADYAKKCGQRPQNVIIFRAGMDEGDVPRIIDEEVVSLAMECQKNKLGLCVVAALKRCHLRVDPAPIGLVIDTDIIPPHGCTFFEVPQLANIGTPTAMRFTVLSNSVDALKTSSSPLETLVFKQAHMFYGWWATTREPSVVMYAARYAKMAALTEKASLGATAPGAISCL